MVKLHIAQLNIARMLAPLDSPAMADFTANLDKINALADHSPGFIWRLKGDDNNATSVRIFEDDSLLVNISVWQDLDALSQFVYKSEHMEILKRRKEWFPKMKEMHMALWYIKPGNNPTTKEAEERLLHLRQHGETPFAFTYKKVFTPEEAENFVRN